MIIAYLLLLLVLLLLVLRYTRKKEILTACIDKIVVTPVQTSQILVHLLTCILVLFWPYWHSDSPMTPSSSHHHHQMLSSLLLASCMRILEITFLVREFCLVLYYALY